MLSNVIIQTYQFKNITMQYIKDNYASLTHTFLSTFILFVLGALASTDPSQLLSSKYWTLNVIVSIVSAGIRAGIKAISPLKQ